MILRIPFIIGLMLILFACNQDTAKNTSPELIQLEKSVRETPNGENISALLAAYNAIIRDKETSRKELKEVLDKAYSVTLEQGWDKELIGFISTYLKEFPSSPGNEEKLAKLIELMKNRNQKVTVQALSLSFTEAYPESSLVDSIRMGVDTSLTGTEQFLDQMAERVFVDAGESGLNVVNAREYVNACEAYALVLPGRKNAPRYLFNAAEISRTIKTFDKTLYLYDWIIDKYPKFEKAPTALFMKGFILENELNNKEKAIETYRAFLQEYPSHDLADDVQFLLDNIGKSNEEILEMIEKNRHEE